MKMTLEFQLPEDEAEARASLDGMDHLSAIHEFREYLRGIVKYEKPVELNQIYMDYCELMSEFL
jgi:hypothetical protein